MLVLKRLVGQQIVIAGTVRLTVLKIKGNKITIGIDAPVTIPILRGELLEECQASASGEELASTLTPS